MNSSGTVVGQVYDEFPFVYSNGTLTTLANFGGNYGYAYAVNASGTVVGYSSNADNWEQAFSYAGVVATAFGVGESRTVKFDGERAKKDVTGEGETKVKGKKGKKSDTGGAK